MPRNPKTRTIDGKTYVLRFIRKRKADAHQAVVNLNLIGTNARVFKNPSGKTYGIYIPQSQARYKPRRIK